MNQWTEIFDIQSDAEFEHWALKIFHFQYENTLVYREFCSRLGVTDPQSIEEIPFLPISFFKTHEVIHKDLGSKLVFKSSGTTGQTRSVHKLVDPKMYENSFFATYRNQIGNPKDQVILALLPNYLEQGESSLVYMVDHLIRATENELSGFLLNQPQEIEKRYHQAISSNKKVILFGVSYALLDLAEKGLDLSAALVIETGGMKGRRKELSKSELHAQLKKGLNVEFVASEYGMTELLSQGYSLANGRFLLPKWMRIQLREVNDPLSSLRTKKTGGIRVIDLANVFSCSFIDTQDLGRFVDNELELMGRYDFADTRGCNLLVQ